MTLQNLVAADHEVHAITIHLEQEIQSKSEEISRFNSTSLFGSDDLRKKLIAHLDGLLQLQKIYMLAMQCRVMANAILFFKAPDGNEFAANVRDLTEQLQSSNGLAINWQQVKKTVAIHLEKMKPLFEFRNSTNANALLVSKKLATMNDSFNSQLDELQNFSRRINHRGKQRVMLQVENGRVVAGRYIGE